MNKNLIEIGVLMVMCIVFFALGVNSEESYPDSLIKQCEQTLPRDQHCKIIAIPENGNG